MIKYIGLYRQLIILKISKIMFKVCDMVISIIFYCSKVKELAVHLITIVTSK